MGAIIQFLSGAEWLYTNIYIFADRFFIRLENTDIKIIAEVSRLLAMDTGAIAVIPHSNPDGDAIGSAYALANLLKNAGKEVKIVTPNDYPAFLAWLQGEVEIINYRKNKTVAKSYLSECSLLFLVDFNEPGRLDEMEKVLQSLPGKRILIDHHPGPVSFCDYTISEPTYSSTAELVFDVIHGIGWETFMDKRTAEALFLGIMTDTGSFSYGTSRPGLYRALSSLMTFGIDTEKIHSLVYDNFSADRFRFMGYCLQHKMVVLPEYRTAYIAITDNELKMFNFVPGDTEGFVNLPLSIQDVVFSALFMEKDKYVKASFRSKGSFQVNAFSSAHFEGGGHVNAAGGESKLSLEKVIELFTQLLPQYDNLLKNE
jgi:bifunctional oligoribonuclease and PAP phosphatase NrnA